MRGRIADKDRDGHVENSYSQSRDTTGDAGHVSRGPLILISSVYYLLSNESIYTKLLQTAPGRDCYHNFMHMT
jgi:hypothetical protein